MKALVLRLYRDSLFQNSMYPILATAVMAVLGFFFWLIGARLYSSEDIGLAGALISVMGMISVLSLVGFDTATIRFLSHEENKSESINTGIAVVGGASLLLSALFVFFVGIFSPQLAFIQAHPYTAFAFVMFCVMAAINMFTDAIFLALRETRFTFIIDTAFSLIKVLLPFVFIPWGAFGMFTAAATAQAVGFVLSVGVLMRRFDYTPSIHINTSLISRVRGYSIGNYVADAMNFLPATMLPIIVTNRMGPDHAAHYYIVMMIVGLLYVIPSSSMRALFAEGSHDDTSIPAHVRGSLKTSVLLLVPAIVVLFLVGEFVLRLFGTEYASSGLSFLYVMVLVSVLVTVFTLFGTMFRLTHNIRGLIARNIAYAISVIVLVYALLPLGMIGIGLAYAGGYIIASVLSYVLFQVHARKEHAELARRLSIRHTLHVLWVMANERIIWPLKTIVQCKMLYIRARVRKNMPPVTLLCYPDKPRTYHTLYKIAHRVGWKIVNNPRRQADLYMHFEDTTQRNTHECLAALSRDHRVLNAQCLDISKQHVGDVFERTFGYPLSVNPTTYVGPCVRKSNRNAVHDGAFVSCPIKPEEGYVYQKHIDTKCPDGRYMDLRIPIFGDDIPFILKRYKAGDDMFDKTIATELVETSAILNTDEHALVLQFCRMMGLDYGELDALRDNNDGRLYIVDVNNTPAGPIGPLYKDKSSLERWYALLETSMRTAFQPEQR